MLPSEELSNALKTDSELLALLGGKPKVFFMAPKVKVGGIIPGTPPYPLTYPYVVYSEASDKGAFYADNTEMAAEIAWNVSVLHTGSTSAVANRIVKIMADIGYYRDMKHDLSDGGVYLKAMRFKGIKEVS
jgi:hypothetical protein